MILWAYNISRLLNLKWRMRTQWIRRILHWCVVSHIDDYPVFKIAEREIEVLRLCHSNSLNLMVERKEQHSFLCKRIDMIGEKHHQYSGEVDNLHSKINFTLNGFLFVTGYMSACRKVYKLPGYDAHILRDVWIEKLLQYNGAQL